jgi:putative SOS response-associated peptidase YedK
MEPTHNRMPVILSPQNYSRWLDPGDPAQLPVDLLRPYPAEEMRAWKVSAAVGNVRNNNPELRLRLDSAKFLESSIKFLERWAGKS